MVQRYGGIFCRRRDARALWQRGICVIYFRLNAECEACIQKRGHTFSVRDTAKLQLQL